MLGSLAEIPPLFWQRQIILRQKLAAMYRPSVEAYVSCTLTSTAIIFCCRFAFTLIGIPKLFFELIIYVIVLYFAIHLQQTAGQFLWVISVDFFPRFRSNVTNFESLTFLFVFMTILVIQSLFRGITTAFKSAAAAQAVSGILDILILATTFLTDLPRRLDAYCTRVHVRHFILLPHIVG